MGMKKGVAVFWPEGLDRSSAPEAMGPSAARVIENLEVDARGRLRRRGGLSAVGVDETLEQVLNCGVFVRRDGEVLLLDHLSGGDVRMTVGPVVDKSDADEVGGRGTDAWYENFEEDGEAPELP